MAMAAFVDPRAVPVAAATKPLARTTSDLGALSELHRLCRDSRLYDVERWIQAGRPLQAAQGIPAQQRRVASALEIALEAENHALVLLLLCNGYDPNLESSCPLDLALRARRWDLLDLLLEWGADPKQVSLSDLFDSYGTEWFKRFRALGVDLTANHEMAEALGYHTSNKPLFGFAKRHRDEDPKIQTELNIALVQHAEEGNEKGVQLCLWAGADPHAPAASLRYPDWTDDDNSGSDDADRFLGFTAIHQACRRGDVQILERLGPDPSRDDFDDLYQTADNGSVIKLLARSALPKNVGAVIRSQLSWLTFPFGHARSLDTLEGLFESGARWERSPQEEISHIRRGLLELSDSNFVDVMKLFATDAYCSPAILQELGRTPAMRARMRKVGFIPSPADNNQDFYRSRPTRSREVLSKFGVEVPKPTSRLPRCVEIGAWRRDGREIRLNRSALFDRVWSEPVEQLAKEWGLSGRGLAKACHRLQVPVPPRGYWAKAQHGQQMRRPRLPELPSGEAEEIVIRAAKSESGTIK
jgi:hypothetical protein